MASTLTRLLIHITFSTKHRAPFIPQHVEEHLYAYCGGICRNHESQLLKIGGTADHLHLLVSLSKNIALSNFMLHLKRDSSKWMKPSTHDFAWQDGYFAFSIGESGVDALSSYIADQKQHHERIDFRDEMRAFCRKYRVTLNEEYAWR